MSQVLVLDVNYQPFTVVHWHSAIKIVLKGSAEVIETDPKRFIRTVSTQYPMPSVIKLIKPLKILYKKTEFRFNKRAVYARDGGICGYCMKRINFKKATLDHIIPKSLGGKTKWDNVISACYNCNYNKGSRTPEQAGMTLKIIPTVPKGLPLKLAILKRWGYKRLVESWATWFPKEPMVQ